MTIYILIALGSAVVFWLALAWWGKKQANACDIPIALKASFWETNRDKSWRLK
jgi:hypothetical protein